MVALTATEPPHAATHWTSAAMAKAVGISVSSVQRIWRAHGLAPHRMRHFKLSNDPDFVPKLKAIVGLYVDPVMELQAAINCYLEEAIHDPKPFVWTANPDKIIAAVNRGREVLDSIH